MWAFAEPNGLHFVLGMKHILLLLNRGYKGLIHLWLYFLSQI